DSLLLTVNLQWKDRDVLALAQRWNSLDAYALSSGLIEERTAYKPSENDHHDRGRDPHPALARQIEIHARRMDDRVRDHLRKCVGADVWVSLPGIQLLQQFHDRVIAIGRLTFQTAADDCAQRTRHAVLYIGGGLGNFTRSPHQ